MFGWLFGEKTQCGLCGSTRMGDRPGIVRMFVEEFDEPIEREICSGCADQLDEDAAATKKMMLDDGD